MARIKKWKIHVRVHVDMHGFERVVDINAHKSFEGFQPLFPSSKFSSSPFFSQTSHFHLPSPKIRISSSLSFSNPFFLTSPYPFSINCDNMVRSLSLSITLHFFMEITAYIQLYAYHIHHFCFSITDIFISMFEYSYWQKWYCFHAYCSIRCMHTLLNFENCYFYDFGKSTLINSMPRIFHVTL